MKNSSNNTFRVLGGILVYPVCYLLFWLFVFILERPFFFFFNEASSSFSFGDFLTTVSHGIPMDLSTVAYFSALPIVLLIVSSFTRKNRWVETPIKLITVFFLVLTSIIAFGDLFLYPYWGFRLDITPLFYLESPKNAAASASLFELIRYIVCICLFTVSASYLFFKLHKRVFVKCERNWCSLILLLFVPLLFLMARGGTGVSVMNVGRVYFSDKQFLNHAAINPNWNFIYSFQKADDYNQYYILQDEEASAIFNSLSIGRNAPPDTSLFEGRSDVLLFIMEGFSGSVCSALGGEDAMPNVSRYAEEGVLFENFYANSFRTDRGLAAILASYPGMPTTSLMKLAAKSQNVPMFPQALKRSGYATSYYYGGDINFTNQNSFVTIAGYDRVVSDKDFESKYLQSKWGALDGVLLERVMSDYEKDVFRSPYFCTVQTSSSHEPYEVPYSHHIHPYVNSVMYADSCLGATLDKLKASKYWDNLLVVILADHATRYPDSIANHQKERYHIPMVWTGGVIKSHLVVSDYCSQIDLGATLLAQFGLDTNDYVFSKNIFSRKSSKFAPFSFNNGFGFVFSDGFASYDYGPQSVFYETDSLTTKAGKAFIQSVYKDLERR